MGKIKYKRFNNEENGIGELIGKKACEKLVEFVNKNKLKVISITTSGRFGESVYLFYEESSQKLQNGK